MHMTCCIIRSFSIVGLQIDKAYAKNPNAPRTRAHVKFVLFARTGREKEEWFRR